MGIKRGSSKKVITENMRGLIAAGHTEKQALEIALNIAGKKASASPKNLKPTKPPKLIQSNKPTLRPRARSSPKRKKAA